MLIYNMVFYTINFLGILNLIINKQRKIQEMRIILIILCLLALGACHRANRTERRVRPTGQFTSLIVAQDDIGRDPSQYFLCGAQLREREWVSRLPRQQRIGWRRWVRYLFNGRTSFRNMTNGINLFFCNEKDWKIRITKTFETGNKTNTKWREALMCPAGTYAIGIDPKFAVIRGVDQGLTGLQLACSSPTFDRTQIVDDKVSQSKPQLLKGNQGTFISGVRVRQQRGYKITGILVAFEPIPKITDFSFAFNIPADLSLDPVEIDTVSESNTGPDVIQKTLKAEKQVMFKNNWKLVKKDHVNNYTIQVPVPSGFFPSVPEANPIQHFKDPQNFAFNKELTSTLFFERDILTAIPSCTKVAITTVLNQKVTELRFNLTVTYSSRFDNKQIGTSTYEGVWSGTLTGKIELRPSETALENCSVPKPAQNLRTETP